MDPIDRTQLHTAIIKLQQKAVKDAKVSPLLQQALAAFKVRRWAEAQRFFDEAAGKFNPPTPVTQLLVVAGKASSRAEARRQIQRGAVHVDGVQLRHVGALVTRQNIVSFRGETLN